jgi:ADP-ribosylglycohydrolase
LKDVSNIHLLGDGWKADEALAIAIYCSLKYSNDFEKAIIASVNHRGDSDSTGSLTGNILGAYLGIQDIPQKFKTNLEFYDLIIDIATDLHKCTKMSADDMISDSIWKQKYIDKTYTA